MPPRHALATNSQTSCWATRHAVGGFNKSKATHYMSAVAIWIDTVLQRKIHEIYKH